MILRLSINRTDYVHTKPNADYDMLLSPLNFRKGQTRPLQKHIKNQYKIDFLAKFCVNPKSLPLLPPSLPLIILEYPSLTHNAEHTVLLASLPLCFQFVYIENNFFKEKNKQICKLN